jgi:hypothetical protein
LAAATTWPATDELVEQLKNQPTDFSKIADLSSAIPPNSNVSKNAQPTSASALISNNIKTEHTNFHKVLTSGEPAEPSPPVYEKQTFNENFGESEGLVQKVEAVVFKTMPVSEVTVVWATSMAKHFPGAAVDLTSKQKGALALVLQHLGSFQNKNGIASFQHRAADIIEFGLSHWKQWKMKPTCADPESFLNALGEVVNGWHKAGCPPQAPMSA